MNANRKPCSFRVSVQSGNKNSRQVHRCSMSRNKFDCRRTRCCFKSFCRVLIAIRPRVDGCFTSTWLHIASYTLNRSISRTQDHAELLIDYYYNEPREVQARKAAAHSLGPFTPLSYLHLYGRRESVAVPHSSTIIRNNCRNNRTSLHSTSNNIVVIPAIKKPTIFFPFSKDVGVSMYGISRRFFQHVSVVRDFGCRKERQFKVR